MIASVTMVSFVLKILSASLWVILLSCSRTNKLVYKPYGPLMCVQRCQDTADLFRFVLEDLSCHLVQVNSSFRREHCTPDCSAKVLIENNTSCHCYSSAVKGRCSTILPDGRTEDLFRESPTSACERDAMSDQSRDCNGLHLACKKGNLCVVQYILTNRTAYIDCRGVRGQTPVMTAAEHGQEHIFSFLLNKGCNLSTLTANNDNLLNMAVRGGNVCIVKQLVLCYNFKVERRGCHGWTPLIQAVFYGYRRIFQFLVSKGSSMTVTAIGKFQTNILHIACMGGSVDMVRRILSKNIFRIDARDTRGNTPLLYAARLGKVRVVDFLLKNGCQARAVNNQNENILHVACILGNLNVVKYIFKNHIIERGSRDKFGNTPVLLAAKNGHRAVLNLLKDKGCNMKETNYHGNNILHEVCRTDNVEMARYILTLQVVDIDSQGVSDLTPVMVAAGTGHNNVVELLVREGCNLALLSKEGNNVLHVACKNGHIDVVRYLITLKYINLLKMNRRGQTPFSIAQLKAHSAIAHLLKPLHA